MSLVSIPLGDTVSLVVEQPTYGIAVIQAPEQSAFTSLQASTALVASVGADSALVVQDEPSSAQVVQTPSEAVLISQDVGTTALAVQNTAEVYGGNMPPLVLLFSCSGGPPGPPGESSEASIQLVAGENLSSGRLVVANAGLAYYFDPSNSSHSGRAFGITTSSAAMGSAVSIKQNGTITDAAFSFSSDSPVFSGPDGELFEFPPVSGSVQQVGVSVSATQLFINIMPTYVRI